MFYTLSVLAQVGDAYRLCWSHAPSSLADYKVELDDVVELAGPDLAEFECTMGLPCGITAPGFGLVAESARARSYFVS